MKQKRATTKVHETSIIKAEQEIEKRPIESFDHLIDSFLASQDIRPISKEIYKKGCKAIRSPSRTGQPS